MPLPDRMGRVGGGAHAGDEAVGASRDRARAGSEVGPSSTARSSPRCSCCAYPRTERASSVPLSGGSATCAVPDRGPRPPGPGCAGAYGDRDVDAEERPHTKSNAGLRVQDQASDGVPIGQRERTHAHLGGPSGQGLRM